MTEMMNEPTMTTGLNIFANIGIDLGKKIDALAASNDRLWRRLQANTPVNYSAYASGVYPSTGTLTLNLGSPDQGTYWEIHGISVGGTDWTVTAAGSAGVYVSGVPGAGGLNNTRDHTSTLPSQAFYGTRVFVVQEVEYLYLVISGGTAGQQYVANCQMTVWPVGGAGGREVSVN